MFVQRRGNEEKPGTAWESMLLAASEELLDESGLSAAVSLPVGAKFEDVADSIIEHARMNPDIDTVVSYLQTHWKLSRPDAIKAIDRTLGGIVRAASLGVWMSLLTGIAIRSLGFHSNALAVNRV